MPSGCACASRSYSSSLITRQRYDYEMNYEDRAHFMNVAASAMRRLLVEQARSRKAGKRWGRQQRIPLDPDGAMATLERDPERLIDLRGAAGGT